MTAHRDLKKIIRQHQSKIGESYTAARAHVMRERAERLGLSDDATSTVRVDTIALKINQLSARVRVLWA